MKRKKNAQNGIIGGNGSENPLCGYRLPISRAGRGISISIVTIVRNARIVRVCELTLQRHKKQGVSDYIFIAVTIRAGG